MKLFDQVQKYQKANGIDDRTMLMKLCDLLEMSGLAPAIVDEVIQPED